MPELRSRNASLAFVWPLGSKAYDASLAWPTKGSHPQESIRREPPTAAPILEPGTAAAITAAAPRNFLRFTRFASLRMFFRRLRCLVRDPSARGRTRLWARLRYPSWELAQ